MTRWWQRGLVVILAASLVTGCGKLTEKPKPPLPPIAPATNPAPVKPANDAAAPANPVAQQVPLLPVTIATIQGADEIPVKAPQSGYLVRQVYQDGATVAAGDVLFLLDPRAAHSQTTLDSAALVRIVAPRAGAPGTALHGAGDWVDTNMELTRLAEIDAVTVTVNLREPLSPRLKAYLDEVARSSARPPSDFELLLPDGSVYAEKGFGWATPPDGSIQVLTINFPNPHHVLQVGEYVKVRSAPR